MNAPAYSRGLRRSMAIRPDMVRRVLDCAGGGDFNLDFIVDRSPGGRPERLGIRDHHAPPELPDEFIATFHFPRSRSAFLPWQSAAVALIELAPDLARAYLRSVDECAALRREVAALRQAAELRGDSGPPLNQAERDLQFYIYQTQKRQLALVARKV